jgi:nitroreductase
MHSDISTIHELIRNRRSPRSFSGEAIDDQSLYLLFEAARHAASSFNEQPWRFIYARHSDQNSFNKLLDCLADGNKSWAAEADVLVLAVVKSVFSHNNKPNRHASHDLGLAIGNMSLQATALGIGIRQMAGFSSEKAREVTGIPDEFEPVTMIAMGYPSEAGFLMPGPGYRPVRRDLNQIAFNGTWTN